MASDLTAQRKGPKEFGTIEKSRPASICICASPSQLSRHTKPCFSVGIVESESQLALGFSESIAYHISGSIFGAGSDTTVAELDGFVQAMVLYPSSQSRIPRYTSSWTASAATPASPTQTIGRRCDTSASR